MLKLFLWVFYGWSNLTTLKLNQIAKLKVFSNSYFSSDIKGLNVYAKKKKFNFNAVWEFDNKTKQKVYEKQKGICNITGKKLDISEMEADHITPWHEGGKTIEENCQMICKEANRRKSGK